MSAVPRDRWLLPVLESFLPPGALTAVCAAARERYWTAAVRLGVCSDAELVELVGERLRVRPADLGATCPQGRDLIPEALARRYGVLPLAATAVALDVATSDPGDIDAERALAFAAGRRVRFRLAPPAAIAAGIEDLYRPDGAMGEAVASAASDADDEDVRARSLPAPARAVLAQAGTRPVIRLVDLLIAEGIAARASDLHLEPEEGGGIAIRHRIDGVLRAGRTLPRSVGLPLVSRVKIIAGMDIADRLRPQDGRARVAVDGAAVDLRVSTLPSAHGEKVVIRVLDQRATLLSLDALGLPPDDAARLAALLDVREGMVLVTGPTGSGKTTTLYSALKRTQERGVNVVTVEDPVEYRLAGTVQVQTNDKAGLTFATALRSILRQDPDVVLVGEVRDRETAGIAVQAALTGHLVLSTLHTNDAAGAVTRLLDLGVEGAKAAGAIKGVVAQRLLRRICPSCRVPASAPPPPTLAPWLPADSDRFVARGCEECAVTGYRGRMAIAEVLVVVPPVARAIAAEASAERIAAIAVEQGMRSLWAAGVGRVAAGETTADELLRVLGAPPTGLAPVAPVVRPLAAATGARGDAAVTLRVVTGDGRAASGAALAELRALLAGAGYAVAGPAAVAEPSAAGEAPMLVVRRADQTYDATAAVPAAGLRRAAAPGTLPPAAAWAPAVPPGGASPPPA